MYVSKVLHNTLMKNDEEGTIAAAATTIHMDDDGYCLPVRGGVLPDFTMVIDHPFYMMIRDLSNETILFSAYISKIEHGEQY
ncbi:MAG: hypothetical protein HQK52_20655 [Oligoflexia bacterium]|nr:hypothetical protein [Oligoflexia bacterium]